MNPLTPQQRKMVEDLFDRAMEAKPADLEAWLTTACPNDPLVRLRVAKLLKADVATKAGEAARGGVPSAVNRAAAGPLERKPQAESNEPPPIPKEIGRYRILSLLGHGGMGTVYEAEQSQPKRTVALKVIRASVLSAELLRRFEHESQVLARLQHPGIAQVYEAGTVPDEHGQPMPFFAMELIRGVPLAEFAAKKNLSTRERMELIARICDAVNHAHQKGVIHRDLKPENILVDESGQPKVLDFGVARATDGDIKRTTLQVEIGKLIGTVPYMSPEQTRGNPDDLDTRSDVYALGVIAYELLAGRLPYDLEKRVVQEAVRIICDEEPTRLSSINRTLRGDIETIVAKALEKDRTRRYPTAEAFASDIRHYLKDEPIEARPANTWYQLSKFSRRNKALVGGIAASFLILVVGLVATTLQNKEIQRQKTLAEANAISEGKARKRAENINAFVSKTLQFSDPHTGGKQNATIAEAMQVAIREIDSGAFKEDPETEASIKSVIGTIVLNNGNVVDAENYLRQSLDTYRQIYQGDRAEVARCMNQLALAQQAAGKAEESEPLFMQALEMQKRLHGGDHVDVATALNNLAGVQHVLGRPADAEPLYLQALQMFRRLFNIDEPNIANGLNNVAFVMEDLGRPSEAEPLYVEALDMYKRIYNGDHPAVARLLCNVAGVRWSLGRPKEAESYFVLALEMSQRIYSGDHPSVANILDNLAHVRKLTGSATETEQSFVNVLEMRQRLYKGDHPDVALSLRNLAALRDRLGHLEDAESLYRKSLEMYQRIYTSDHLFVARGLNDLAFQLQILGRISEAEELYLNALEMQERLIKVDTIQTADYLGNLAVARMLLGRIAEAEPLFIRELKMRQRLFDSDHTSVAISLINLAQVYQRLGKAEQSRQEFDNAVGMRRRLTPTGSPDLASVLWRSGSARLDAQGAAAALPELEEALAMAESFLPPDHPQLKEYRDTLAKCKSMIVDK